jgi:hypothetical protein
MGLRCGRGWPECGGEASFLVRTKPTKGTKGPWGGERGGLLSGSGAGIALRQKLPAAPGPVLTLCAFVIFVRTDSGGRRCEAVGVLPEDFQAVFAAAVFPGKVRDDGVELGGEGGEIGGGTSEEGGEGG